MMKRLAILMISATALSACSIFTSVDGGKTEQGDAEKVFDTRLGVNVDELMDALPDNLAGDKKNARYTEGELKGKDGSGNQ